MARSPPKGATRAQKRGMKGWEVSMRNIRIRVVWVKDKCSGSQFRGAHCFVLLPDSNAEVSQICFALSASPSKNSAKSLTVKK